MDKNLHISFVCCNFANKIAKEQIERTIMLGFGANNGVEIKGRFADEMRATMKRVRTGRLNAADRAALRFQQESGNVTLVRG